MTELLSERAFEARYPAELITAGQFARLVGVTPSAVSNWRKRARDFPVPWLEVPVAGARYSSIGLWVHAELEEWYAARVARAANARARRIEKLERDLERLKSCAIRRDGRGTVTRKNDRRTV